MVGGRPPRRRPRRARAPGFDYRLVLTVAALLLILVLVLSGPGDHGSSPGGGTVEVDDVVQVLRVVDGDTFACKSIRTGAEYKVRLADINASELGTAAGEEAKRYLASLIENKTLILDIDDVHRTDKYGRVVAVAYLPYNETHLVNVNLLLVRENLAEIKDYSNEFNPNTWTLYVPKPEGSP